MKSCPKCDRTFDDSLAFCLEDGSVLSAPIKDSLSGIEPSEAAPTEFIPGSDSILTVTAQLRDRTDSEELPEDFRQKPKWRLFGTIGVALASILLIVGVIAFYRSTASNVGTESGSALLTELTGLLNRFVAGTDPRVLEPLLDKEFTVTSRSGAEISRADVLKAPTDNDLKCIVTHTIADARLTDSGPETAAITYTQTTMLDTAKCPGPGEAVTAAAADFVRRDGRWKIARVRYLK